MMGDVMGKLILDAFIYFVKETTSNVIEWFLMIITQINGLAIKVFELPVVVSAITYSQILAASILILKVAYEALISYILRLDGNPDADPGGLLMRTARSAAVIGCVPWIVNWIFQFGTAFSKDVTDLKGMDLKSGIATLDDTFIKILESTTAQYLLIISPILVFSVILLIFVSLQTLVRGAELAMIAVTGSFMALGLTNPDSQMFGSWWRELLNVSLSQVIQLFMIKVSFFALADAKFSGGFIILNVLMFIASLWVAYKSPTVLKQYIYSTGVGRSAAGATRSVASMTIMRKVFTRGI